MKKAGTECDLKSCVLCKECMNDWMPAINAHKQNIRFKKGETLFEEGSQVRGIYFLYKGLVKVHKRWGEDKSLILRFAKEGEMVGYRGLGNEKIYPVTATALEDVTTCFIDLPFFETTLRVNHQLTYELLQFYANELQDAERRMRNLAHMSVKGRVAETLLMLKNNFGDAETGHINVILSKQDMASYSGTTYETFFRMFGELVNEKIIAVSGKEITILKYNELKLIVNC